MLWIVYTHRILEHPAAPKNHLELIFCNCETSSCGKACCCRKAGLYCSEICRYFDINGCTNFSQVVEDGDDVDDNMDINDDNEDQKETLIRNIDNKEGANESDGAF